MPDKAALRFHKRSCPPSDAKQPGLFQFRHSEAKTDCTLSIIDFFVRWENFGLSADIDSSPSVLTAYANSLSISSENQIRTGKLRLMREALAKTEISMKLVPVEAQFSVN